MRVFRVREKLFMGHDKFDRRVIHRSCGDRTFQGLLASMNNSGRAISRSNARPFRDTSNHSTTSKRTPFIPSRIETHHRSAGLRHGVVPEPVPQPHRSAGLRHGVVP